jgi:opacity protein-like surface antigen
MRQRSLIALLGLAVLSPAQAVDWHVGVGALDALEDRSLFEPRDGAKGESGVTAVAGLQFGRGFGIEAAWADLGELERSNLADAGYLTEGDLWSLGLTWTTQRGALRPYAKAGLFQREEEGSALTIAGPRRVSDDDSGWMAEAGARWHISDLFALRAGYAHYDFDRGGDGSVQVVAELHFQ